MISTTASCSHLHMQGIHLLMNNRPTLHRLPQRAREHSNSAGRSVFTPHFDVDARRDKVSIQAILICVQQSVIRMSSISRVLSCFSTCLRSFGGPRPDSLWTQGGCRNLSPRSLRGRWRSQCHTFCLADVIRRVADKRLCRRSWLCLCDAAVSSLMCRGAAYACASIPPSETSMANGASIITACVCVATGWVSDTATESRHRRTTPPSPCKVGGSAESSITG